MKKINLRIYFIFLSSCFFALHAEQKIFLTAIPKCGTHLAGRLIMLITQQSWMTAEDNLLTLSDASVATFNATFNTFLGSHATACPHNIEIIRNNKYRGVFVYRDPRDQVISFAHYIMKIERNWPELSRKSFDDIITELIINVSCIRSLSNDTVWNIPELESFSTITALYDAYVGWRDQPFIYTTTFEKIIGPKGGGSQEVQLTEIMHIAKFLGFSIDRSQAQFIADDLFGHTHTFRNGQIGEWKLYFNEHHKQIFKEVAGQLLIDLGYEKDFNW